MSNFDDKVERLNTVDDLIKAVQSLQQYGIIRQQLSTKYVIHLLHNKMICCQSVSVVYLD